MAINNWRGPANNQGGGAGGNPGALLNSAKVIQNIVAVGDAFDNFSKSALNMSLLFAQLAPSGDSASKTLKGLAGIFSKITAAAKLFGVSKVKPPPPPPPPKAESGSGVINIIAESVFITAAQIASGAASGAIAAPTRVVPLGQTAPTIATDHDTHPGAAKKKDPSEKFGDAHRDSLEFVGAVAGGGAAAASAAAGATSSAAVAAGAKAAASGLTAVSGLATKLAGPVGLAAEAMAEAARAAVAVVGAFYSAVMAAAQYVQVSNPAAVMALNLVMADLTAVIGTALLPVVQFGTKVFRDFADTMLPVARRVADVLGGLGKVIEPIAMMFNLVIGKMASIVVTYFQYLVDVISAFAPAIESLMGVLSVLMNVYNQIIQVIASILVPIFRVLGVAASLIMSVFKVVATVIYAVISVIAALFGAIVNVVMSVLEPFILGFEFVAEIVEIVADAFATLMEGVIAVFGAFTAFFDFKSIFAGLKEYLGSLASAFKKLSVYMILFIAGIAKMLGFASAYKAITDKLKGGAKESSSGLAAAVNPTIKSAEQLGQDVMQTAFVNTSVMPGEKANTSKEDEFMAQVSKFIELMDKDGLTGIIAAGIVAGAAATVKESVVKPLVNAYDNTLGAAGGWIGDQVVRGLTAVGAF